MAYYPSNAKYERDNLVAVRVAFNRRTEPELVERIEREDNRAGYLKRLVSEDIRREQEQGGDQSADH
jgi:hypothetical protein